MLLGQGLGDEEQEPGEPMEKGTATATDPIRSDGVPLQTLHDVRAENLRDGG